MNPYQNDYSNFVPQLIPGCWGSLKGCSFFFNISEYAGNANEFGYLFAILYSESQSYSAVNAEFVHSNGMWIVGGTQAFSENKKCFVHTDVSGGVLSNTTFCCTNVIGTASFSTTTPTGGTAASPSTQKGNNASTLNIFSAIFVFMMMFLGLKLNNQLLLITIFACLTSSTFAVPVCTDVSVAMSVVDSNNQTIDSLGINLQLIQFGPNVYIMSMYNFVQSHQNTNENFSMPRYILFGANIYNISNDNNNYTFGGIADGPGYLWIQ
uniref:DOMON domain-containing protein n=1 Tax=Panagrolaimus sp. JU765 TaxID=591449 RepID=A0AC34RLM1_9BILA